MAQRRMFSPKIVASDAFLDMPTSSRELYFQLGMYADDDGFINPRKIIRMVGASEDDLKVLTAKRFVLPFENGVVVIKHWAINNLIRKDWYQSTIYTEQKNMLITKDNGAYTEAVKQNVNEMLTIRQHRLGKVRLGKNTNLVADATVEEFNFEKELLKMKEGVRKDWKIIALFWKKKGWVFENREQFNAAFKRELRAAKDLKGYTGNQIAVAIAYCEKEYPEKWTLETVFKRITDLVNKK